MNVLEGFNDWKSVIKPIRKREVGVMRLVLSKSCFTTMNTLGFRGIFMIDERRVSDERTNASTLEELKTNLPVEVKIVPGFDRKGKSEFDSLNVVLQGFCRDENNNLVIKIDSPSRVNKR